MLRALMLASALGLAAASAQAQTAPGQGPAYGPAPTPPPAPGAPGGYAVPSSPGGGGRFGGDPQMRALRQKMRAACAADMSTYCAAVGPGGHGEIAQCMMANRTKFSPGCTTAMQQMRAYRRAALAATPQPGEPPMTGGPQPR